MATYSAGESYYRRIWQRRPRVADGVTDLGDPFGFATVTAVLLRAAFLAGTLQVGLELSR